MQRFKVKGGGERKLADFEFPRLEKWNFQI